MNVLLSPSPSHFPHHHNTAHFSPSSPGFSYSTMSGLGKRKAADDLDPFRSSLQDEASLEDTSMSASPSPAIPSRTLAPIRNPKKRRGNEITGRPLALSRLLETLDATSLRQVLRSICERHSDIGNEVVNTAPKPSVVSALEVLAQYQSTLKAAFPFGSGASDYAYNRVKEELRSLMDALADYTPHYLPPNELQASISLAYLDGATNVIHDLPDWESASQRHHKDNAYDEIAQAWALVVSEASKKGGGIQLANGGWDQKITKHNEQSGFKMQAAVNALSTNLVWMGNPPQPEVSERESIRRQLFSGTYGNNMPVRVGP